MNGALDNNMVSSGVAMRSEREIEALSIPKTAENLSLLPYLLLGRLPFDVPFPVKISMDIVCGSSGLFSYYSIKFDKTWKLYVICCEAQVGFPTYLIQDC